MREKVLIVDDIELNREILAVALGDQYDIVQAEDGVRQITERGYSVAEVSDRLGVSAHSLYKWLRAIKPDNSEQHARDLLEAKSEILKLRAQLKRTEEERDILKKAARYFAREPD